MKVKGWTVMELMIVVIIISLLAAIVMPKFFNAMERVKQGEALSILARMHRGYKTAIVDRLICSCDYSYNLPPSFTGAGSCCGIGNDKSWFNPDELDSYPDYQPNGHSQPSWRVLEFDENPNQENPNYLFSYDFLKTMVTGSSWSDGEMRSIGSDAFGRGFGSNGIRPSGGDCSGGVCDSRDLGVAWRKNGTDYSNGLPRVSPDRWIAIDMQNGTIYKSDFYN